MLESFLNDLISLIFINIKFFKSKNLHVNGIKKDCEDSEFKRDFSYD